jgi:hypothetical protein
MSRLLNVTLNATFNTALIATVALLFTAGSSLMAADEHKHEHGHGHGDMIAVGNVTLGTVVAKVEGAGVPAAGKEWHVTVDLPPGTAAPKAIRVWVGIESGRGSEKAKANPEAAHPGGHEAHVDVPAPLPEGSNLWVSLEPVAGDTVKGSLALPAAGAKPAGEHDHDHEKKK